MVALPGLLHVRVIPGSAVVQYLLEMIIQQDLVFLLVHFLELALRRAHDLEHELHDQRLQKRRVLVRLQGGGDQAAVELVAVLGCDLALSHILGGAGVAGLELVQRPLPGIGKVAVQEAVVRGVGGGMPAGPGGPVPFARSGGKAQAGLLCPARRQRHPPLCPPVRQVPFRDEKPALRPGGGIHHGLVHTGQAPPSAYVAVGQHIPRRGLPACGRIPGTGSDPRGLGASAPGQLHPPYGRRRTDLRHHPAPRDCLGCMAGICLHPRQGLPSGGLRTQRPLPCLVPRQPPSDCTGAVHLEHHLQRELPLRRVRHGQFPPLRRARAAGSHRLLLLHGQ